jgi:hypothetical protein
MSVDTTIKLSKEQVVSIIARTQELCGEEVDVSNVEQGEVDTVAGVINAFLEQGGHKEIGAKANLPDGFITQMVVLGTL